MAYSKQNERAAEEFAGLVMRYKRFMFAHVRSGGERITMRFDTEELRYIVRILRSSDLGRRHFTIIQGGNGSQHYRFMGVEIVETR